MQQLVYVSEIIAGGSDVSADIVATSRRNNPELGLTGLLVVSDDLFLQIIEGDGERLEFLMHEIARDKRHRDVRVLSRRGVARPSFPDWSMGYHRDITDGAGGGDLRDALIAARAGDAAAVETLIGQLRLIRARQPEAGQSESRTG